MIERSYVKRSKGANTSVRIPVLRSAFSGALLGAIILSGCTHHANPDQELTAGIAPFTDSRDKIVRLVASAKHSLGAEDLNSLAVVYTPLEEKANAYAHFLVESVSSTSFDADQNNVRALELTEAISTFNKNFAKIASSKQAASATPSAWVAPFAAKVATDWGKYDAAMNAMSSPAKADLIKQLRNATLWPNYEDIATEPLATPPH
ncbi:MAG: hypothetical protein WCC84_12905 [Candidatus Cybelea sp.]